MRSIILSLLVVLSVSVTVFAEQAVIFSGVPEMKISEGGVSRIPEKLTKSSATKVRCTITKADERYYWTSRENVELMPIISGAFITYWALNGSGYVRVVRPEMRVELRIASAALGDPEAKFDYVEHLLLGLKSVTYYGKEN
jgi:hypothetical protein